MKRMILYFLTLFSITGFGQHITGIVRNDQGNALAMANVILHQAADSSVNKIAVSNSAGKFEFKAIKHGNYFITITHAGYAEKKSSFFEINQNGETAIPAIVLERKTADLQNVTVVAKKPLVEVKADKTILNVEGSINAVGSDALELLRKSPGVLVDRDDNLSLAGKNGVQIFFDGRPSPLTGKDLSQYLKSLNSNSIEAIEIITNPSAKYDAAGNAGIINIRSKKNKAFGTNGSITAGYNIGKFSKYNGGFSMNHRNNHINLYGNYNFNGGLNENFMNLHREVVDTLFDQVMMMHNNISTHNFKAGMDYFINKKNTAGIIVNGTIAENSLGNLSQTSISYIPNGEINRLLVADNRTDAKRQNLNFNLNYRYADTMGRELNADSDYGNYLMRNNQYQPNYYFDPVSKDELYRVVNNMISPTDIDIYSLKVDYEQPLAKGKLGVGGKTSLVWTKNNFGWYDIDGSNKDLNLSRSNFFEYKENIHALYLNYNRQLKGVIIQAGLRMENTQSEGNSYPLNSDGSINKSSKRSFIRRYTNFFPSAAVTFNRNPMSQLNFTYSRRIDRPAYHDLNPFEFKLDEYTFQKGNTALRPQYTNSFGITHSYNYKLNTSLSYSKVKDVLAQIVDTTEKSKSFLTKKNMATQQIVSLNINYAFTFKWYTLFANLNTYYSHYIADFGPGREIDLDVYAFNIYMQHSFNLGKEWRGEISGWYVSPSIWQGFSQSSKMWSMDAGLQKNIFKGAGNLKVSVSDIFQTMRWKGVSRFAGQNNISSGGWESRLLKLNFVWRFGNTQMKAARERKTGTEDENKRVQQDSNSQNRQ